MPHNAETEPRGGELMVVKQLYRVEEVAEILSMGRSTVFDLIRSGRLASVKEGAMRRVTEDAIRDYVRKLAEEWR